MSTNRNSSRLTCGLGRPSLIHFPQFSPTGGTGVDIRSASGGIGSGGDPSERLIASNELTLLSLVLCCGPNAIARSSSYALIEARKLAMRSAHTGSLGSLWHSRNRRNSPPTTSVVWDMGQFRGKSDTPRVVCQNYYYHHQHLAQHTGPVRLQNPRDIAPRFLLSCERRHLVDGRTDLRPHQHPYSHPRSPWVI